jgi:hypothetical protein
MPFPALAATIVLPDFIRSCSVDERSHLKESVLLHNPWNKSGQRPDRKAGRVYGGNAGLAFAMCEARKKRKNRQGGMKLFSVLIFWLLLYQDKSNSPAAIERA